MADGYRGLFGAFPYAFRRSESWTFRSYVVLGGLAAGLVSLFVGIGLIVLIANTAGVGGGSLTLSRSFYVVVGLFAVAPMLAPVLLVARRHRRGRGGSAAASRRYDALLAVAGYLFVVSVYVAVVISMPESWTLDGEVVTRPPPSGPLAPVVAALYDLPRLSAVVPPLLAAGLIATVHRLAR
jgi:uncharacterized membrane protein YuzA (DUF378 family)